MSFLVIFNNFISKQHIVFISSTFVLINVFIRFYLRVFGYPKGPFPHPVIGNLNYINTWTNVANPHKKLSQLHLKYGPVFTIWLSRKPLVFIADSQLIKEAFQKPEFCDRGFKYISKLFTIDRGQDFAFNDYNRVYVDLKKVVLLALRKYVMTDKLDKATIECVDEFWSEIKIKRLDNSIDMPKYVHLIIAKIISKSLFGAQYTLDDPELKYLKNATKKVPRAVDLINLLDGLPNVVAQFLFSMLVKTSWLGFPEIVKIMEVKYYKHKNSYEDGRIRDVVDALIVAKENGILENNVLAEHLNDINLINILTDLFVAGVDSTTCMSEWIFLLMAKYPEMQTKMRKEIRDVIGLRMPKQQDKEKCHFTMSFIHESLRLNTPVAIAIAHQTKTDMEVGEHKIPGRTSIISYLHGIHRNMNLWLNPNQFNPSRILDTDGKLNASQIPDLMPFGAGRRSCPGDKLAQIVGFLILARVLQLTNQLGLQFVGDGPIAIEPDPCLIIVPEPIVYKLVLKQC